MSDHLLAEEVATLARESTIQANKETLERAAQNIRDFDRTRRKIFSLVPGTGSLTAAFRKIETALHRLEELDR
jgi:hypothetical protein